MGLTRTGHAEIDEQHKILDTMVAQLDMLCEVARSTHAPDCADCSWDRQMHCRNTLTRTVGELGAFLIGHATYEERMMELLPDTPACQAHIRAHKAAHQGLARQIERLGNDARTQSPLEASREVWRMMETWLGDHTTLFDKRLVSMAQTDAPEINLDNELVEMLDRHVFPNRPTLRRSGKGGSLQQARNDCRQRYESLSPAQRNVFWLVVGGRKNAEIAEALAISINTVKTHRAAIFQKMDVTSVVELVKKTDLLR